MVFGRPFSATAAKNFGFLNKYVNRNIGDIIDESKELLLAVVKDGNLERTVLSALKRNIYPLLNYTPNFHSKI